MNYTTTTFNTFSGLEINITYVPTDIQPSFFFNRTSCQVRFSVARSAIKSIWKYKSYASFFKISYARLHKLSRFGFRNNLLNFCQPIQIIVDTVNVGTTRKPDLVVNNRCKLSNRILPPDLAMRRLVGNRAQKFKMFIEVVLAYTKTEHHLFRLYYQRMIRVGNICFVAIRQNTY